MIIRQHDRVRLRAKINAHTKPDTGIVMTKPARNINGILEVLVVWDDETMASERIPTQILMPIHD